MKRSRVESLQTQSKRRLYELGSVAVLRQLVEVGVMTYHELVKGLLDMFGFSRQRLKYDQSADYSLDTCFDYERLRRLELPYMCRLRRIQTIAYWGASPHEPQPDDNPRMFGRWWPPARW